jgi:membrane protein DedA with SNARE-associated domain
MESFLTHAGYAALVIFGFLEACCIPISSEVTFGFAGILAFEGHLNLVLVIVIGSLAELAGSYVSYGVGRVGGRPLVDRFGKYVLITRRDVDRAERFFAGRGAWAVPVGRMLPVIRAFVSIVAGLVGVPAVQFGVLSLIGTVIYAIVLTLIGYEVGSAWHSIQHYISIGGIVLIVIVVLLAVGFVLYRLREVRKEAAADRAAQGSPGGQAAQGGAGGQAAQGGAGGQAAQGRPGRQGEPGVAPASQGRGRHASKD